MLTLSFQTRTVSNPSSSPLNSLTVTNWLTVKFHYSIIGPTVKILNTLCLLAHLNDAVVLACINPCKRPTGSLSLSLCLCPSKLLYKHVTIAFQPKTKLLILNKSVPTIKCRILTSSKIYAAGYIYSYPCFCFGTFFYFGYCWGLFVDSF